MPRPNVSVVLLYQKKSRSLSRLPLTLAFMHAPR